MVNHRQKLSVGVRLLIIGGLIVLLLIPSMMIKIIIGEREHRRTEVLEEITAKWGETQQLTGPILSIPIKYQPSDNRGNSANGLRYIYLLPETLNIQGEIHSEVRYRGIYQIILYGSRLEIQGNFNLNDLRNLNLKENIIEFQDAIMEFGVSDLKEVIDSIQLKWNDQLFDAEAGILHCTTLDQGFHLNSPLSAEQQNYPFSFTLYLNGSEEIRFTPIGKYT